MESVLLISATPNSNNTTWSFVKPLSRTEGIAWCIVFAFESVLIVAGNLLTIILFAVNKKLRKKSLFLVINMAFADLMLGAVSVPFYIYFTGGYYQLWTIEMTTSLLIFSIIVQNVFLQASVISAVFISAERFYAIYWPFKHRTLWIRTYFFIIFMVWLFSLIASVVFTFEIQLFASKLASSTMLVFFFISIFIFCGCNIAIWKRIQRESIVAPQQKNRASQIQRLSEILSTVSLVALLAWLPSVSMNCLLVIFKISVPWSIYLAATAVNFSNSFINPVLYALRIPGFREALRLCCIRRQAVIPMDRKAIERCKRENRAGVLTPATRSASQSDPSHLQLACIDKVMETQL